MARPQDQLADVLQTLRTLQEGGNTAVRSSDLSRPYRERLVAAGFLEPVFKGWYVSTRPEEQGTGESTS